MKTILYFQLLICLLPLKVNAQNFEYQISGTIKGLNQDTLVFANRDGMGTLPIKVVGKNDNFIFHGSATKNSQVVVSIANKPKLSNFNLFLEKGEIHVFGDISEFAKSFATGGPINDEYSEGKKLERVFYDQRSALLNQSRSMDEKSEGYKQLMVKVDSVNREFEKFRVKYIAAHPNSMLSGQMLYVMQDVLNADELEKLYTPLSNNVKSLGIIQGLPKKIEAKRSSENGNLAPSFSLKDINGKMINLADYRGRYVLLDFWASWCEPCREKSPGLKKVYDKFKSKGFEIISVSSDTNEKSWKKAIADDHLEGWINICDLKGLNNEIANKYGVQPIPDSFLIGPDGKIVERQLFGEKLEQQLSAILGNR